MSSGWNPEQSEQILSTLNRDGSRRWMRPRVSPGRFLNLRRALGYFLIALFIALPFININGKPAILLNLPDRQFTFFGFTFLPTDTLLLAFFVVGFVVTVFLVTALLGRVWCGYMCPQLVYLEFVYRPLEYLLEGKPAFGGRSGKKGTPVRRFVKYALYLVISLVLAHVFLAYFIGVEQLSKWVQGSPLDHFWTFFAVMVTTGLMMFNFCYFREQTCILACPYGRLQSVLLDRNSLIISYDPTRGEPRGRLVRNPGPDTPARGDCIDCRMCVDTCPTGIDIRNGLQLECVGCAQCIDACDAVMTKIKKPRGLIRYSSQARIAHEGGRILRPRVIIYPLILLVIGSAFGFTLVNKQTADVTLLRGVGRPFTERDSGEIVNQVRLKIVNRGEAPATYSVRVVDDLPIELHLKEHPIPVAPGESRTLGVQVVTGPDIYRDGNCDIEVEVSDGAEFSERISYRLMGPRTGRIAPASTQEVADEQ